MDRRGRLPRRAGDLIARALSWPLALLPLPGVRAWQGSVEAATGERPRPGTRRLLLENWLRNTLWSLSLAHWTDDEILAVASITDEEVDRLRESLAGPGLVLALPHMGSWDFAGAWCATVGIKVVSVAERLPDGLYERFRDARAGMGMDIHPVDLPGLLGVLTDDVRAGRLVCLLSDRDLSSRGWASRGLAPTPRSGCRPAPRSWRGVPARTCAWPRPGSRADGSASGSPNASTVTRRGNSWPAPSPCSPITSPRPPGAG
ncbi:LpxL/LpxP family acyltransferase [Tessaracoccus defluvii]|uniref:Phosphatidylinositol mannoside acyltransferase n=1 Tax=Tessaracoccus defluvii TaxID=1285901 RepID=A0A7H0H8H4_9ACTN|nr:hypothetical protein [Tessaracoccus defluvii]QNP56840.1 hypothetical protein H9L22_05685 [Tessaracoccus defluvii]